MVGAANIKVAPLSSVLSSIIGTRWLGEEASIYLWWRPDDKAYDVVLNQYFVPGQVSYGLSPNILDRVDFPVNLRGTTLVQFGLPFYRKKEGLF